MTDVTQAGCHACRARLSFSCMDKQWENSAGQGDSVWLITHFKLDNVLEWGDDTLYCMFDFVFLVFFSNPDSINQPPRFLSNKSQDWNFVLDDTTLDVNQAFLDTLGENVVDDHDICMRKKTQMRNGATKTKSME